MGLLFYSVSLPLVALILTCIGLMAVTVKLAADYVEFNSLKKMKILTGRWEHKMDGHIVIFGSPKQGYVEFFEDIKKALLLNLGDRAPECIVVTADWNNHIPDRLHSLGFRYLNCSQYNPTCLEKINLDKASQVLVLVDNVVPSEIDYANIELVSRIREGGFKGAIVAEITNEIHRPRMKKVGATGIQRPNRSHPEILVKALLFPGTEEILDQLFTARGDNLIKKEFTFKGSWDELVNLCLDKHGGLPISILTWDNKVVTNPINEKFLDTKAVFILVKENQAMVKRGLKVHSEYLKKAA